MPTYARKHQLTKSLVYHVYNRSHRGERIFERDQDFEYFQTLLIDYKERFHLKFYHWVIMSNHYHFSIQIDEPEKLSGVMAGLQRSYTCYYNREKRTRGYLWEGRFRSQPIEAEKYLMACGRYIERNPVRAGMVRLGEEYRYSSARYYCFGQVDGITDEDPCFSRFGNDEATRRSKHSQFLSRFDYEEERQFQDLSKPLGGKLFVARLVRNGYNFMSRRRGRPRKNISITL